MNLNENVMSPKGWSQKNLYSSDKIPRNNISCLNFFPQNSITNLNSRDLKAKQLQLLQFIINEIIEAFNAFYFHKKLSEFDPHIADTLCQIRAYKILKLSQEKSEVILKSELRYLEKIKFTIESFIIHFEEAKVIYGGKYNKLLDGAISIEDFIIGNNLFFTVSEELYFLLLSRILSFFSSINDNGISVGIDYKALAVKAKASISFTRRLVKFYQKNVARISCEFIINICKNLHGADFKALNLILPYLKVTDSDGREILPCYEVTRVLLADILKCKKNILLVIESKSNTVLYKYLFVPNKLINDFEIHQGPVCYLDKPCIVVRGATVLSRHQFIAKIRKIGLIKLILSNMAKHPQYPVEVTNEIGANPYQPLLDSAKITNIKKVGCYNAFEYKGFQIANAAIKLQKGLFSMKKMAEANGCYMEDFKLFVVKHIYCDLLVNQIGKSFVPLVMKRIKSNNALYKIDDLSKRILNVMLA